MLFSTGFSAVLLNKPHVPTTAWRGWVAERAFRAQLQRAAAVCIQCWARRLAARTAFHQADGAAFVIHRRWRSLSAERALRARAVAAVTLQSAYRGVVARRELGALRTARRESEAALHLQVGRPFGRNPPDFHPERVVFL
jgi:hypothetical protein